MLDSLDARAKKVFDEAIELPPAEREAILDRRCAGDSELRRRVEELLNSAEKDDVFLNGPTLGSVQTAVSLSEAEQPGTHIGPYKLLERIGEGGFGSVFMAEQTVPIHRRVALKIIKLGMDTRAVVARFEQERQALALMDHPNIAKVLDAGATDNGRPYFVMELVKGDPITAYCDAGNLSVPERLELFTQVCRAVQHAHTKGIIHRDIKPSNVLVNTQDGKPFCKVIDFGIAKATQRPIVDKTVFTEFHQLIGTLEYMSPEQAAGSLDLDTRTDVYSLGVLLYELLAGVTPFDPQRLRSAAFGEMQRIIREVDPPPPSTRLSQAKGTLANVAALRRTEPKKLGAMMRGELDWIVMRALDKNRARRYESPGNFAADVERYLAGEPVEAAPPGLAYRASKVIRRHRFGVMAAGLIALALIVGLGAALWQARIAERERDSARKSAAEAQIARKNAEARAREIEQVAEFQSSQLKGLDVQEMGKRLHEDLLADAKAGMERAGVPAAEREARLARFSKSLDDVNPTNVALKTLDENIFVRALKAADAQFKDQPLVKARLLQALAETMIELGLLERATVPQAEALDIRRKQLGPRHPDTLDSTYGMGELLHAQGKLAEAEAHLRQAVESMTSVLGEDDHQTLNAIITLGTVLQLEGKLPEAEKCDRDSLMRYERRFGPDHEDTIAALNNVGFLLFAQGKLMEAEKYFQESLARMRRTKGDDDSNTLVVMNNLASIIQRRGKLAEAESLFREALERSRRIQGEDHPSTLQFANNMGFVLYLEGKYAESEPYTRDTLSKRRRVLHDDHWDTMQSINNVGLLLQAEGKLDEAEPYFREALERRRRVLGADHQATLQSVCNLGILLKEKGKLSEAEPYYREALEKRLKTLGDAHPDTLESISNMGALCVVQGKLADAEREFRRAAEGYLKHFGENYVDTARARLDLGVALRDEGKFSEAETVLLQAESTLEKEPSKDTPSNRRCVQALVKLYENWDKSDSTKSHEAKAAKWRSVLK